VNLKAPALTLTLLSLLAFQPPRAGAFSELQSRRELDAIEAQASKTMVELEEKISLLRLLSKSYVDAADPMTLDRQRRTLRTEIDGLRSRLAGLHHNHRELRERAGLISLVRTMYRAKNRAKADFNEGAVFLSSVEAGGIEGAMSNLLDKTRQIADQDELDYDAALKAYKARRLKYAGLIVLLALLALAGAVAFRLRRPRLSRGSILTGGYRVDRVLAKGRIGTVYIATDMGLGRQVALKCIRDKIFMDARRREAFLGAARSAAALRHESIAQIFAAFADAGRVFLVSEFVDGRPLSSFLGSGQPLPLPTMKLVVRRIAQAVDYAHGRRIAHGSLKPSDVMLARNGSVKVLDFAVSAETGAGAAESDVYALGALLGAMALGRSLRSPEEAAGLPPPLGAIVGRAMGADKSARYRLCGELAAELEAVGARP